MSDKPKKEAMTRRLHQHKPEPHIVNGGGVCRCGAYCTMKDSQLTSVMLDQRTPPDLEPDEVLPEHVKQMDPKMLHVYVSTIEHLGCAVCRGGMGSDLHVSPEAVAAESFDAVNKPKHYTLGKVECIDAIESATLGLDGFEGALVFQVVKYIWRWKQKNGVEDLKKCRWYLDRLIAHAEKKP